MAKKDKELSLMDEIVGLCKRRGFIFQTSEIYGGINGFFDYGPLGVELRRNIKDAWWKDMVHLRDDVVGLDSSIIMHSDVWKASGHVDSFTDPMVDCKESKMRYRADHLFYAHVLVDGKEIGCVSLLESEKMESEALEMAQALKRKLAVQGELEPLQLKPYTEAPEEDWVKVPSPATGEPGSLTPPREFNMMFKTNVGALQDASSVAYLRPETAQGIFANFKNVVDTGRVKVPFGIAQVGKAFRNEITPGTSFFALGNSNRWKSSTSFRPTKIFGNGIIGNGLIRERIGSLALDLQQSILARRFTLGISLPTMRVLVLTLPLNSPLVSRNWKV